VASEVSILDWDRLGGKLRPYLTYEYRGEMYEIKTAEDLAVWQTRMKENRA
jgi:hypothetical protein